MAQDETEGGGEVGVRGDSQRVVVKLGSDGFFGDAGIEFDGIPQVGRNCVGGVVGEGGGDDQKVFVADGRDFLLPDDNLVGKLGGGDGQVQVGGGVDRSEEVFAHRDVAGGLAQNFGRVGVDGIESEVLLADNGKGKKCEAD